MYGSINRVSINYESINRLIAVSLDKEQRAESREQRAESREQRAESREQKKTP
jgi:hypothetical protein